ncbi:hypothetical protein H2203_005427 [Taxawa tesnikishii (nom. ined.)]|nr:hypothetical protein H2203_005427 [Dothideales sp. JES 119]
MNASSARLDIIVNGAGLSGLATAITCALHGHAVTVLESALDVIEDTGAAVQITPNGARLLEHWGVLSQLWEATATPTVFSIHRYNGALLARERDFDKNMEAKYSAPFFDVFRSDLQRVLYTRAKELGVRFRFDEEVISIDLPTSSISEFAGPEVATASGKLFTGDLVIGADGLCSVTRRGLPGQRVSPKPNGTHIYRAALPIDHVLDEKLRTLIRYPEVHFWIGPGIHAVGYSLRNGSAYSLTLFVETAIPKSVDAIGEMRELLAGWDPILEKILDHVDTVDKRSLMHYEELQRWANSDSNLVLAGESCHPMLPCLGQEANSSLEDGVVLGTLLGKLTSKAQLPHALHLYERLRKTRGQAVLKETLNQRYDFHLPDGIEQEARDATFLRQLGKEVTAPFPSRWTCPGVQEWLYGYDAVKDVEDALRRSPWSENPMNGKCKQLTGKNTAATVSTASSGEQVVVKQRPLLSRLKSKLRKPSS